MKEPSKGGKKIKVAFYFPGKMARFQIKKKKQTKKKQLNIK